MRDPDVIYVVMFLGSRRVPYALRNLKRGFVAQHAKPGLLLSHRYIHTSGSGAAEPDPEVYIPTP